MHACGLKSDGSAVCWGTGAGALPPTDPGPYLSVSAGGFHSCGLKTNGTVACWGDNTYGQAPPAGTPVLAGPYLSLTVGRYHNCGLKAGGSVVCWGAGGAADPVASLPHYRQSAPPNAGAGPYLSIAAGYYHSCGLKPDGSAECWGDNALAQAPPVGTPVLAGPYVALSTGWQHTCGLKADGSTTCWGNDVNGQASPPSSVSGAGSLSFGQIAAGNAHACEVKRDGRLSCWGSNDEGQATPPDGLFTQVVAGDAHSCAIGTDGKVTCWGRNGAANTAATDIADGLWRQLAPGPDGAICALSANADEALCRRGAVSRPFNGAQFRNITHDLDSDGLPALCGPSLYQGGESYCKSSAVLPGLPQRLESGLNHKCVLMVDGSIECWGGNADGQLDNTPAATEKFRALSVGWNHACAIKGDGQLACWGSNLNGQTDAPAGTYVQVAAGNTFTCAIRSDGQRVCWGASPGNPLFLNPASLDDGIAGVAYSQELSVSGSAIPELLGYYVVAGSLPPGVTLDESTGAIGGTPSAAGTYTFTIDATGDGEFTATRTYTVFIDDPTPPVISYTLNGAAPGSDPTAWYTTDVALAWSVPDAESSISSKTGCVDETLNTDTSGTTRSCTASSAGGSSNLTTVNIRRDATKPTLAPSVPSPLLRGQSYSASPNANDATSGVASQSCGALDTSSLGTKSTTCSATDNAGNSITVPLNYTVTTTCANDGYKGTQLSWCVQICESGLTGQALDNWIHRWFRQFHNYPYCVAPQQTSGLPY